MRMIRTIMDAKITSNIYCICMSFDTATSRLQKFASVTFCTTVQKKWITERNKEALRGSNLSTQRTCVQHDGVDDVGVLDGKPERHALWRRHGVAPPVFAAEPEPPEAHEHEPAPSGPGLRHHPPQRGAGRGARALPRRARARRCRGGDSPRDVRGRGRARRAHLSVGAAARPRSGATARRRPPAAGLAASRCGLPQRRHSSQAPQPRREGHAVRSVSGRARNLGAVLSVSRLFADLEIFPCTWAQPREPLD